MTIGTLDSTWLLCLVGLAAAWIASLVLVRWLTRRRLLAAWSQAEVKEGELEIHPENPQPQDQAALDLLRDYRRRHLLKLWPDTSLSFAVVNDLSQNLVKEIAALYYPEEERPELRASLADLVALYRRVGVRLSDWLEVLPLRPLKNLELATALRLHETYQQMKNHQVYRFLKRHHLDRAARWVWGAYNLANPWYWGRRAAYTGSREVFGRLFLAKVVSVVGEEAIRLYSRRSPNLRIFRRYQAGVQEMVNLALEADGDLAAPVSSYILKLVLKAKGLEDQEKVALLRKLARPRLQDTDPAGLEAADRQEIRGWLEALVRICWSGPARRERLAQVREKWQEI